MENELDCRPEVERVDSAEQQSEHRVCVVFSGIRECSQDPEDAAGFVLSSGSDWGRVGAILRPFIFC